MRHGVRAIAPVLGIYILASANLVLAQDSPQDRSENPAQPYRCEDSTITKTGYYFEGQPDSGIYAVFASKLGVEGFPDSQAAVVDRGVPLNSVMAKQTVGDKVQICLIKAPPKDQWCDPTKDSRGRFTGSITIA
jgi:hypothetical protein